MAENEPLQRRIHAHEANIITYGSVGAATYNQQAREWNFQRALSSSENEAAKNVLKAIDNSSSVLLETSKGDETDEKIFHKFKLRKEDLSFAPAQYVIRDLVHNNGSFGAVRGPRIAHGSAIWLGVEGLDSGSAKVPVTAVVTGTGSDELMISCLGREHVNYIGEDGIKTPLRIPRLISDLRTTISLKQPIEQLVFSASSFSRAVDTFLAVRQASQTSLFEPLVVRDSRKARNNTSSLDLNLQLSIGNAATGGADHADVAFNPHDHRELAIVDVEGNWSIWRIRGQRSHKARELYQARLQTSGKIFSWAHKHRPSGVGVYFDGWHKVQWLSSDGSEVDRILVCNRQNAKLFDVNGDLVSWIDMRLDTSKVNACILSVNSGPNTSSCFVLTTSDVLLFNFSSVDWKDSGRSPGPELVCAIVHGRSGFDLQLSTLRLDSKCVLAVYAPGDQALALWSLDLELTLESRHAALSTQSIFLLPDEVQVQGAKHISFQPVESDPVNEHLVLLVIHGWDASLQTCLLDIIDNSVKSPAIRLPPSRGLQLKSSQRVRLGPESDGDLDDFIVPDIIPDRKRTYGTATTENGKIDTARSARTSITSADLTSGLHILLGADGSRPPRDNLLDALARLEEALMTNDSIENATLLLDLFQTDLRVDDIEVESATLERAVHTIASSLRDKLALMHCTAAAHRSLLSRYESVFDKYVRTLGAEVHDHARMRRERQARELALQLYLSGRTAVRIPQLTAPTSQELATQQLSNFAIHSDPLQPRIYSQPSDMISASQPVNGAGPDTPAALPSPVPDMLARLSACTTIRKPPAQVLIDDESTSKHIASILSHLPASARADPDAYDYKASELDAAILRGEVSAPDVSKDAARKAKKLARARKRAEQYDLPILPKKSEMESRSSPKRRRFSEAKPTLGAPEGERFTLNAASDGHIPGSDQTLVESHVMPATQPERGLYGTRTVSTGQKPKKKKRMAGF